MKISRIFLYDEPAVPEIQIERLAKFLEEKFSVPVKVRESVFSDMTGDTAAKLASIRIFKPKKPFEPHTPTPEEIEIEKNHQVDEDPENIVYYDGFKMQKIISGLVPSEELLLENFHVAFTNRLSCTFDDGDYRYHGRALIGSNPSVISTAGMVEAPAKPREYYFELISNMTRGLNVAEVNKKYAGAYLERHDPRLSCVAEGYLLQAIFYYITGEAFCDTRDCRLHNAHWQKDLLYSQLEFGRLCKKHQDVLDNLK